MGPVNNPAFCVPFIFTGEFNYIAFSQTIESTGNINIVGDKNRLISKRPEEKLLVPNTLHIVMQNLNHFASPSDLYITEPVSMSVDKGRITRNALLRAGWTNTGILPVKSPKNQRNNDEE